MPAAPPRAVCSLACLAQVLGGDGDEFDAPEFDAVAYVNRTFGGEATLGGLDRRIAELSRDIRELDESVLGACGVAVDTRRAASL